jgi:carbon monoxide dehydrogenase subunit G
MIHFKDSFEVPATPDVVMQRFMDVEGIASCVPGASIEGRDPEGNYLGMVTVALGPKKVNFRGKIRCEFDAASQSGVLTGGGVAAGRGASVQVRTGFLIREAPGATASAPCSVVEVDSKVDLQGVLAQFAAAGGNIMAAQLLREFSSALTAQLAETAPAPGGTDAAQEKQPAPKAEVKALPVGKLILMMAWNACKQFYSAVRAKLPGGSVHRTESSPGK